MGIDGGGVAADDDGVEMKTIGEAADDGQLRGIGGGDGDAGGGAGDGIGVGGVAGRVIRVGGGGVGCGLSASATGSAAGGCGARGGGGACGCGTASGARARAAAGTCALRVHLRHGLRVRPLPRERLRRRGPRRNAHVQGIDNFVVGGINDPDLARCADGGGAGKCQDKMGIGIDVGGFVRGESNRGLLGRGVGCREEKQEAARAPTLNRMRDIKLPPRNAIEKN